MVDFNKVNSINFNRTGKIGPTNSSQVKCINDICINMSSGSEEGTQGEWGSFLGQDYWSSTQGWWDDSNNEWDSNGWELVLLTTTAPSGTKMRITFDGIATADLSVRDADGSIHYYDNDSYTSGTEFDLDITDDWGRIYMNGGSFSVTDIEIFQ